MKLFNLLLPSIGRVASRPMRNIETFPSKQMYLYLSLVERNEAEILTIGCSIVRCTLHENVDFGYLSWARRGVLKKDFLLPWNRFLI